MHYVVTGSRLTMCLQGMMPPTLNLERQDPGCRLDVVTGAARSLPVRHAVAVARGLEGQQVALTFSGVAA